MLGRSTIAGQRALSISSLSKNKEVFIIGAARTPVGSFRSQLASVSAPQLGSTAIKAAVERGGLKPEDVQEDGIVKDGLTDAYDLCHMGNCGEKTAKELAISREAQDEYAIGSYKKSAAAWKDGIVKDGLTDAYDLCHMGNCGEKTAKELAISREAQDEYAIGSYKKSAAAWKNGIMAAEVVPVIVKGRKGDVTVDHDEEYKKVDFDKLKSLKTVFQKDGTVTAGNASTLNDGAAAVLLASSEAVKQHGCKPQARILAFADAATNPLDFALAPPLAVKKMLQSAGVKMTEDRSLGSQRSIFGCSLGIYQTSGL
ncbi:thiolase protein [Cooperia oncophora]